MGKIIKLSEAKIVDIIKNVNKQLLKETSVNDFKDFEVDAALDFDFSYTLADGTQIEEIVYPKTIPIKFDLDIYLRKYGIEDILITNIRGPKELEVELVFENKNEDSDEWFENVPHIISLDWSKTEKYPYSRNRSPYTTSIQDIIIVLDKGLFLENIYYTPVGGDDD